MLEVLDDLLWTLRREGLAISPAQAIDVMRVARLVGFSERSTLANALACVVVNRRESRELYDRTFAQFFSRGEAPRALPERLRAQGFTAHEIHCVLELTGEGALAVGAGPLRAILEGGADLDQLLTTESVLAYLERASDPQQVGFYTHRVFERVGVSSARTALVALRQLLAKALGETRADAMAMALLVELSKAEQRIRRWVQRRTEREEPIALAGEALDKPFAALSELETEEVRRSVRVLAAKLSGAARVRRRHARAGRIDGARTVRASFRTAGVPVRVVRVNKARVKPKIVLLCDVSDSVRVASRFMLELVHAVRDIFERTRAFVFVNQVFEVTDLFDTLPTGAAIAQASALGASGNSSYGRAFGLFEQRYRSLVDRRTTLVVLGDGRTNYRADGAPVLRRLCQAAHQVIWICPEPRARWGTGDSAMSAYAAQVTNVLEASNARALERAARELIRRAR